MDTTTTPLEIFCSYADADEALIDTLERHLSVLVREGLVTLWHKRQIPPGSDAKEVLDFHLNRASIILLLVSPDFVYR